jgi:p21-activated kinase 1
MEEIKTPSRRLTKKPPPSVVAAANLSIDVRSTDNQSLRSQRSSASLQRAPSAPYPRSHQQQYGHTRNTTSPNAAAYTSSNSSLDRQISGPSPVLAGSEFGAPVGGAAKASSTGPLSEKTSQEFVGAPFDGTSILNHFDSTKASGYQNSLRRPPPPPLSHTSPDPRMMSPPLRQSASFSAGDKMNEKQPPRVGENQLISPKRYSDETKDTKPGVMRKKSGFSGFMSSIGVGSPRGVKISAPENPVHVTHVGYDNQTGQFTVSVRRGRWTLN